MMRNSFKNEDFHKSLHICVLESFYDYLPSEIPNYDYRTHIAEYLDELGHTFELIPIHKERAVIEIRDLVKSKKFDVFINLCDGSWDEITAGSEVIQALTHYNVPFTGADVHFFEPTRLEMKRACFNSGVPFPNYIIAEDITDVKLGALHLKFPLIIKHFQSYASVDLFKESRVENEQELLKQATRMLNIYNETLIEEFIDGREFSVLIAENPHNPLEPIIYTPLEILFPSEDGKSAFKYYELKWVNFEEMQEIIVIDPILAEKLKDYSKKVFLGLNGTGYARCDFRMDENGTLYFLEINPNCGIFYSKENPGSADFILLNDKDGHVAFVDSILKSAFNRVKKREKWRILSTFDKGFRVYARHEINPNEKIKLGVFNHAVSTHSMNLLNKANGWFPIGHSTDPNAKVNGNNLIAQRRIQFGEEITIYHQKSE